MVQSYKQGFIIKAIVYLKNTKKSVCMKLN